MNKSAKHALKHVPHAKKVIQRKKAAAKAVAKMSVKSATASKKATAAI
jgi:colicin import membrane protein